MHIIIPKYAHLFVQQQFDRLDYWFCLFVFFFLFFFFSSIAIELNINYILNPHGYRYIPFALR